ncbi:MAG: hypothetical protein ACKPAH_05020, partial [Verrucomicrobiota bacterium]
MNRSSSIDGSAPDMDRVPGLRLSRRRFGAWAVAGVASAMGGLGCLGPAGGAALAGSRAFPGVPGTVITHSPASSGLYLGSPS